MSNFYTQFSEILVLENKEQANWVRKQLEPKWMDRLREYEAQKHRTAKKLKVPKWAEGFVLADHILNGGDAYFAWEITDASTPGKFDLALYSEENCDLDAVAAFVQAFLKKFAPDHCFTISWAATNDKMCVGAFGGGGIFITADKVESVETQQWLEAKARPFGPPSNLSL
jgi:hypothetical protein